MVFSPTPMQPNGPPIWIGSWGSTAGMRRVARLADGWLASGYDTTPESFVTTWSTLRGMLEREGRDAFDVPLHDGDELVLRYGRRSRGAGRHRAV